MARQTPPPPPNGKKSQVSEYFPPFSFLVFFSSGIERQRQHSSICFPTECAPLNSFIIGPKSALIKKGFEKKYKQNITPFPHLKEASQEAGENPGVRKFQRKLVMIFKGDFFLGHPVHLIDKNKTKKNYN